MASAQTIEEASFIREQLASYPHADFSLNFTVPDHTDALCQAMIAEGLSSHQKEVSGVSFLHRTWPYYHI